MNNNVKSLYRILCWLKRHDRLDEAGIVQFIEQEETDWYSDSILGYYDSELTKFLRKHRVAKYVIMDRENGL